MVFSFFFLFFKKLVIHLPISVYSLSLFVVVEYYSLCPAMLATAAHII
jgi:hypothetical protein